MSLIAVAVTLGAPPVSGPYPLVATNLGSYVTQAAMDLAALSTGITASIADATTVNNDATTLYSGTVTISSDLGTMVSDFDTAMHNGSSGIADLIGLSYASHQITGTVSVSQTLTAGQCNALVALLNAALNVMKTVNGADLTALQSDVSVTVADAASAKTAALALTALATAVSTDLTNAQSTLSNANVLVQTDSAVVSTTSLLSGALVSALTYVRDSGTLPV